MWKLVLLGIMSSLLVGALSASLVRAQGRHYLVHGAALLGCAVGGLLFVKIVDQLQRRP